MEDGVLGHSGGRRRKGERGRRWGKVGEREGEKYHEGEWNCSSQVEAPTSEASYMRHMEKQ